MNSTSKRSKRLLAAVAVLGAAASAVAVSGSAPVSALPAGTPPEGALDMSPASGNSSTVYTLGFEAGVTNTFCSGDANAGYSWSSFIVPNGTDPATLTFLGGVATDPGGGFAAPLGRSGGGFLVGQPPGLIDGFVNVGGFPLVFNASLYSAGNPDWPGAGEYEIGVACFLNATGESSEYWSTTMTITAPGGGTNSFDYAEGTAAVTPAISVVNGDTVIGVNVTDGGSDPADVSYDITLTEQAPGSNVYSQTFSASDPQPFEITGVAFGTYDVSVIANNGVGDSAPATGTAISSPAPFAAPTDLAASSAGGGVLDVTWTAPAGDSGRTGYTLTADNGVDPVISVSPAAGDTSAQLTGAVAGTTYVVTLTATYPAPNVGTPATTSVTVFSDANMVQVITAERPEGALIFTQRCGVESVDDSNRELTAAPGFEGTDAGSAVNDDIPALPAIPGFPGGLAAVPASADQTGQAPIDLNTGVGDVNFPEYPYPIDEATGLPNPNYTTSCAIDLGIATLVTEVGDPLRGQFFRADGTISQITVVDTRSTDTGWVLEGQMSDFSDGVSQTFSGDYLGWMPVLSAESGTNAINAYDQQVFLPGFPGTPAVPGNAGAIVEPAVPGGLADGEVLAETNAGSGLGISEHDARLMLLIPISADAGTYTGTLTFTATTK